MLLSSVENEDQRKQQLDLTACRLVVTLAKTQLMEQWEQSGGWSGLWSEQEVRSDEHNCGSSLEKCGDWETANPRDQ